VNRILYIGVISAILTVTTYVVTAVWKGKRPDLTDGIIVFLGAVSALGAIRLVGFALTAQFAKVVAATSGDVLWSLSPEDAVFVVIGAITLGWVSVQTIWENFAKLWKTSPPAPSSTTGLPTDRSAK
jgi:hypothetical protein